MYLFVFIYFLKIINKLIILGKIIYINDMHIYLNIFHTIFFDPADVWTSPLADLNCSYKQQEAIDKGRSENRYYALCIILLSINHSLINQQVR